MALGSTNCLKNYLIPTRSNWELKNLFSGVKIGCRPKAITMYVINNKNCLILRSDIVNIY